MFTSLLSLKTVCISLLLVSFVLILGCTMIPRGSEGNIPVTTLPQVTTFPVPTTFLQSGQSAGAIQLVGNVYGLSSDPYRGIDTFTFSLGLPAHAPAVDLTGMEIIFSSPGNAPVTLTQGTRDTTSIFTTTIGGNAVSELHSGEEIDVTFRVKPVSGGTPVTIEVRPPDGTILPISRTVPAMVYSLNVL